ncbi:ribonuclease III [Pontibacter akesuensis]|uniref:Ribonuclease 3 n=1 Tax=Pontibacter akesuensis TaxID=388950 RepID=A0A1I7J4J9_9BACT|nr:ribonuclease III [Pontibacter akesuensis]GHA72474.1 ribonuclease 3 [Pontibacter akesuensis]SFU80090.1 ribonuclease-3 [Pontibacter akesuensis]
MFGPIKPVRRIYHRLFNKDRALVRALAGIIGSTPDNIRLYKLSLTHTSFARQSAAGKHETNERMEFLGDAILGAVVAELLFRKFPYEDEGFLTEIRSRIVNRESLNLIAMKIGLNLLVKVDTTSNSMRHKSVNGNALEALVGAIYLDKGYNTTRDFILGKLIKPHIDLHNLVNTTANFKSKLIEWAQSQNLDIRFEIVKRKQQGNTTEFTSEVYIDDKPIATGVGLSKKKADQAAAEKGLTFLKIS